MRETSGLYETVRTTNKPLPILQIINFPSTYAYLNHNGLIMVSLGQMNSARCSY